MTVDEDLRGEAYTSAVSHINRLSQSVVAHARDLGESDSILPHSHVKAQFIYASEGIITVTTDAAAFLVPPQFAVWMPAGIIHRINTRGSVAMRTLYIGADAIGGLPTEVCVMQVSALLRELVLTAVTYPEAYLPDGREERLMDVILDQLREQQTAPLALAMPREKRIRKVAEALLTNPGDNRGLEQLSKLARASTRTLARLFQAETGMSFRAWRQQLRLQRALEMLADGQAVTPVAIDLGYDGPSAFIAMFRRTLGASPTRYLPSTGA